MEIPTVIQIDDASRVGEVRRVVLSIAEREGLDGSAASNSAIVATELATNLAKHATRGEIHVLPLTSRGLTGIEIISIDQGPGMANLRQALVDGYSTTSTSGTGLGAVQRLSSQLEVFSCQWSGNGSPWPEYSPQHLARRTSQSELPRRPSPENRSQAILGVCTIWLWLPASHSGGRIGSRHPGRRGVIGSSALLHESFRYIAGRVVAACSPCAEGQPRCCRVYRQNRIYPKGRRFCRLG